MKKPKFTCPECEGELQATVEVYLSADSDGELRIADVEMSEIHWYCENDHLMTEAHAKALSDYYRGLDAFGRAPGSGHLDIQLFPHPAAIAERK
jgi:hypothetical protein